MVHHITCRDSQLWNFSALIRKNQLIINNKEPLLPLLIFLSNKLKMLFNKDWIQNKNPRKLQRKNLQKKKLQAVLEKDLINWKNWPKAISDQKLQVVMINGSFCSMLHGVVIVRQWCQILNLLPKMFLQLSDLEKWIVLPTNLFVRTIKYKVILLLSILMQEKEKITTEVDLRAILLDLLKEKQLLTLLQKKSLN